MAAITILATVFISTVFTLDFARTILEIRRDRADMKKAKAGGFSV